MRVAETWVVTDVVGLAGARAGEVFSAAQFSADMSMLDAGRPIVINDVETDGRLDAKPLADLGIRTLLIVPIVRRGEPIGVMVFQHKTRVVPFSAPEVEFAGELVNVATLALDNAALYERERRIADTLQEAMLAPPEPLPELDIAYLYRPASAAANVGGDFYDVFRIDDDRVGILIGDVSGKGT